MSYLAQTRVDGQLAVVTGGGRAIGLACVEALALKARGFDVSVKAGDVTDPDRMDAIADELAADGRPASILVNNAGIAMFGISGETISTADWRHMIDVNLNGVFWCSRAFGRHMVARKQGAVVNLGSMSGLIANRPESHAGYGPSKAAVHHLTKCLAVDWAAHGVRVNAVAPTYIETPMTMGNPDNHDRFPIWKSHTPMGRMGKPEEIASAVLYLASPAASLVTGAVLSVDGGYTCW